jgi:hypothetical protein
MHHEALLGQVVLRRLRARREPRVRSHCSFRNRGIEYVSDSVIKWISSVQSEDATEPDANRGTSFSRGYGAQDGQLSGGEGSTAAAAGAAAVNCCCRRPSRARWPIPAGATVSTCVTAYLAAISIRLYRATRYYLAAPSHRWHGRHAPAARAAARVAAHMHETKGGPWEGSER